jgi:hypothetical protein
LPFVLRKEEEEDRTISPVAGRKLETVLLGRKLSPVEEIRPRGFFPPVVPGRFDTVE